MILSRMLQFMSGRRMLWAVLAGLILGGAGCVTKHTGPQHSLVTLPDPETVMVSYHVQPGREKEFEGVLNQAWDIYLKERMVLPHSRMLFRAEEEPGKTRYVEIFTWVSHAMPEHPPASVTAIWAKMTALCEKRGDRNELEGGEIHFVPPPKK